MDEIIQELTAIKDASKVSSEHVSVWSQRFRSAKRTKGSIRQYKKGRNGGL